MPKLSEVVVWLVKGLCIGVANIIPGVSGGTMALVLGLYERLITALHNMGPRTAIIALKALSFRRPALDAAWAEWKRIDAFFVGTLCAGAGIAIVLSAGVITYLLNTHHDPTYAFFCGLILMSIVTPWKMLRRFGPAQVASVVLAIVLTVLLTMQMASDAHIERERAEHQVKVELQTQREAALAAGQPMVLTNADHAPGQLLFMFVCGALAISAMILPGISGSFLMLLLGAYFPLLAAIKSRDFLVCGVFGVGMGLGILAFTRLLKWLFTNYHDTTVAFLVGLMLGSLYGLWPFRHFEMVGGERVDGRLILPRLDGSLVLTVLAFLAGCAVIGVFLWLEQKLGKHDPPPPDDPGADQQAYDRADAPSA